MVPRGIVAAMFARRSAAPPDAPSDAAASNPFAAQSAMRDALRAGMRHGALALIDIGSTKVAALIVALDPHAFPKGVRDPGPPLPSAAVRVIGAGEQRARGIRRGAIVDIEAAARSIRAAVSQAEREAGVRVFQAVVALSAGYPRSLELSATVDVDGPRVEPKDVKRAFAACRATPDGEMHPFGEGRTALHVAPVNWMVDAEGQLLDPLGAAGRRLSLDLHVLTIADTALQNAAHCLARADLDCAGAALAGVASGLSSLRPEELQDGAACLDMGGGVTAVTLFLRGRLVFADVVRLGGEDVTLDIVRGLGLPHSEAERLKTLEGSAAPTAGSGREPLDLGPDAPAFDAASRPSRADLAHVIRPRVEEVLELARDRLEQAGFGYLPNRRIALTGGAAELTGALETAQRVFGRPARLARPVRLSGVPPSAAGPSGAAAAGLACSALEPPPDLWEAPAVKKAESSGPFGGVLRWFRETW